MADANRPVPVAKIYKQEEAKVRVKETTFYQVHQISVTMTRHIRK